MLEWEKEIAQLIVYAIKAPPKADTFLNIVACFLYGQYARNRMTCVRFFFKLQKNGRYPRFLKLLFIDGLDWCEDWLLLTIFQSFCFVFFASNTLEMIVVLDVYTKLKEFQNNSSAIPNSYVIGGNGSEH